MCLFIREFIKVKFLDLGLFGDLNPVIHLSHNYYSPPPIMYAKGISGIEVSTEYPLSGTMSNTPPLLSTMLFLTVLPHVIISDVPDFGNKNNLYCTFYISSIIPT